MQEKLDKNKKKLDEKLEERIDEVLDDLDELKEEVEDLKKNGVALVDAAEGVVAGRKSKLRGSSVNSKDSKKSKTSV